MYKCVVYLVFCLGCCFLTVSSQNPDFHCNFSSDECDITQATGDHGDWERLTSWERYQASFDWNTGRTDKVTCYLPAFTSREGTMTFIYRADSRGHLEVSVCGDGSDVRMFQDTSDDWTDAQILDISCGSLMSISLTAVQDHGSNAPDIRVDTIEVYQTFPPSATTTSAPPTTHMSTSEIQTTESLAPTSTSYPPSTYFTLRPSTSSSSSSWTTTSKTTSTRLPSSKPISSQSSTSNTTLFTGTTKQTGLADGQSGQSTVIISASVSVVIIVIIAIFFVVTRHRTKASNETASIQKRHQSLTDNAYDNAAFSPEMPNPVQTPYPPDLLQELESSSNADDIVIGSSTRNSATSDVVKPPIGDIDHGYIYARVDRSQTKAFQDTLGDKDTLNDHVYQPLRLNRKPAEDATKGNQNFDNERENRNEGYEPDDHYNALEQTIGFPYHPEQQTVDTPITSDDTDYQHLNHDRSSSEPTAHPDINGYGVLTAESQGEGTYNVLDHGESKQLTLSLRKGVGNKVDSDYNTLGLVDEDDRKFPLSPDNHDNDGAYGVLEHNPITVTSGSNNHGNTYDVLDRGPNTTTDNHVLNTGVEEGDFHHYHALFAKDHLDQSDPQESTDVDDYNILNSGKEIGDYHEYQDPSAKEDLERASQQGDPDAEDYTILYSGKELGDYHQYQEVAHHGQSDDVYYSAIKHHDTTDKEATQHEPIYSNNQKRP